MNVSQMFINSLLKISVCIYRINTDKCFYHPFGKFKFLYPPPNPKHLSAQDKELAQKCFKNPLSEI